MENVRICYSSGDAGEPPRLKSVKSNANIRL